MMVTYRPLPVVGLCDRAFAGTQYVSPREKQLLRRFASGKTDRQIAKELGDTESGIAVQRMRIAEKFCIHTDEQFSAIASQFAKWPRR